jgi:hypothetical protein
MTYAALPKTADRKIEHSPVYSSLPLYFETDQGQTDRQVKFISRGVGYALFLTLFGVTMVLDEASSAAAENKEPGLRSVVKMSLIEANPDPGMVGLDEQPGRSHYFSGDNPTRGALICPILPRCKINKSGRASTWYYPTTNWSTISKYLLGAKTIQIDLNGHV